MEEKIFNACNIINENTKGTDIYDNVYIKGGCLRNLLLNKETFNDIDVAVYNGDNYIKFSKMLCDNFKCRSIYNPFIEKSNNSSVFTLFSLPDFSDIRFDVKAFVGETIIDDCNKKMDFTCNALYLKTTTDLIIDATGKGFNDIENHILRMVHDNIFNESPIRIIRMLRFQQQLNFEIDSKTYEKAIESLELLQEVNPEWINQECDKINPIFNLKELTDLYSDIRMKYYKKDK